MGKIRINDSLHDELRKFIDKSATYSKQSEFVSEAVRKLLEDKRESISSREAIEKIVNEYSDETA